MNDNDFGLRKIGQIAVNVYDLDRATAFYRDVLGMEFLFTAPPGMAFFRCADVRLLLGTPERPELEHPSSIIYFDVEDIAAVHERLRENGVEFVAEPRAVHRDGEKELWLAFFKDSEGNVQALMSEVASG